VPAGLYIPTGLSTHPPTCLPTYPHTYLPTHPTPQNTPRVQHRHHRPRQGERLPEVTARPPPTPPAIDARVLNSHTGRARAPSASHRRATLRHAVLSPSPRAAPYSAGSCPSAATPYPSRASRRARPRARTRARAPRPARCPKPPPPPPPPLPPPRTQSIQGPFLDEGDVARGTALPARGSLNLYCAKRELLPGLLPRLPGNASAAPAAASAA
jgi:hypothetical protein